MWILFLPITRWIAAGLLIAGLAWGVVHYRDKVVKIEDAKIKLEQTLKTEREANEAAGKVKDMTPEEMIDNWKKKQQEYPMTPDEMKERQKVDC
jgi:Zn-dependent peptidase ImmA (M78 family)